ncbi:MAG: NAD(P)/FAD-dependent oxidoreductase, partial [Candidatus Heimdallarchaeaceae archaeon]
MLILSPKEEEESTEIREFELGIIGLGPAGLTSAIYASRPAGLTSAIYASRAGINVVCIGRDYGGQMGLALEIENYPGFENISGIELTDKMKDQAEKFGTTIVFGEVEKAEKTEDNRFLIKTVIGNYLVKALILATGGRHMELNVPG